MYDGSCYILGAIVGKIEDGNIHYILKCQRITEGNDYFEITALAEKRRIDSASAFGSKEHTLLKIIQDFETICVNKKDVKLFRYRNRKDEKE